MNKKLMPYFMGTVAIGAGVLVNYLGDKLLGMRLELFWGVGTFSPLWVLDLFVVPLVAGFVVSVVYGVGGKLLCYFVPIIVRTVSYVQMYNYDGLPEGITLLPVAYWLLVLIVAIEAAAIGGVFGEIMIKKTYGRRPKHLVYKQAADQPPVNSDIK